MYHCHHCHRIARASTPGPVPDDELAIDADSEPSEEPPEMLEVRASTPGPVPDDELDIDDLIVPDEVLRTMEGETAAQRCRRSQHRLNFSSSGCLRNTDAWRALKWSGCTLTV